MTPTKWAQLLAVSLCSVAQTCAAVSEAHGLHRVVPAWPGKPYNFACPLHTPPEVCARIGKFGELSCAEPESETEEIVTAFLLNCENCTYVDIGCNLGLFSLQAAALGAHVHCYEPTPFFADTIRFAAARRSSGQARAFEVHLAAVVTSEAPVPTNLTFRKTITTCGMGVEDLQRLGQWTVPTVTATEIVRGKKVALLKVDIDSIEGALLHEVVELIAVGQAEVETMVVELGDNRGTDATMSRRCWPAQKRGCRTMARSLRGGSVHDVWKLVHELGYDAYRVNIHMMREIYDWKGANVNGQMAPQGPHLTPLFGVRGMRKLELLSKDMPIERYPSLFRWGQSWLFTRIPLVTYARHHEYDTARIVKLNFQPPHGIHPTSRTQAILNVGIPESAARNSGGPVGATNLTSSTITAARTNV